MIKMDQRGQISIEFVLIIAIMVVVVLAIAPSIGDANEKNVVASAARSGATNAITNLTLLNRSMAPTTRVDDISTIGTGQNVTIQIDISNSLSTYQNQTIINSTLSSIAAQGYTLNNNSVVTSRHTYRVTLA